MSVIFWFSGLFCGAAIVSFFSRKTAAYFNKSLLDHMASSNHHIEFLTFRLHEEEAKVREMRWLLHGGIDGDPDLEAMVEAKDRRDASLARPAQETWSDDRVIGMSNKTKSSQ